jgi:hypothetical protein
MLIEFIGQPIYPLLPANEFNIYIPKAIYKLINIFTLIKG